MKIFVAIYNDSTLLPHFIRHYQSLGDNQFFVATSPRFAQQLHRACSSFPVQVFDQLNVTESVWGGSSAVSQMRHRWQGEDEWVVIVDLDEFLSPGDSLPILCEQAEAAGANVVRGVMVDRFAADGGLPVVADDTVDLEELLPIRSRFIRDVMGGCDQKGVLVRGLLMPAEMAGHHRFVAERVHREPIEIAHFKWIHGSVERLRTSLALVRQQGVSWQAEYQRALDFHDLHHGFDWRRFGGTPADKFCLEPVDRCARCGAVLDHLEAAYSTRMHGKQLCRRHQLEP